MSLHIATPGVPLSTPKPGGTINGLERASSLGIEAMELEWVQRVPTNVEHLEDIGATARTLKMHLTVHAPYYVNLNADDPAKLLASKQRVITALAMAHIVGARSVCVHAAFYLNGTPDTALDNVRRAVEDILRRKQDLFPNVNLALETMGKPSQFGTVEEVLRVSKEFGQYPCMDPAHLHARSNGKVNTAAEWNEMLDLYAKELGDASLKNMHLHYSGIAYGPKGEKHHLSFKESDAKWEEFLSVLKKRDIGGILVCESPLMELDAVLLKKTYWSLGKQ